MLFNVSPSLDPGSELSRFSITYERRQRKAARLEEKKVEEEEEEMVVRDEGCDWMPETPAKRRPDSPEGVPDGKRRLPYQLRSLDRPRNAGEVEEIVAPPATPLPKEKIIRTSKRPMPWKTSKSSRKYCNQSNNIVEGKSKATLANEVHLFSPLHWVDCRKRSVRDFSGKIYETDNARVAHFSLFRRRFRVDRSLVKTRKLALNFSKNCRKRRGPKSRMEEKRGAVEAKSEGRVRVELEQLAIEQVDEEKQLGAKHKAAVETTVVVQVGKGEEVGKPDEAHGKHRNCAGLRARLEESKSENYLGPVVSPSSCIGEAKLKGRVPVERKSKLTRSDEVQWGPFDWIGCRKRSVRDFSGKIYEIDNAGVAYFSLFRRRCRIDRFLVETRKLALNFPKSCKKRRSGQRKGKKSYTVDVAKSCIEELGALEGRSEGQALEQLHVDHEEKQLGDQCKALEEEVVVQVGHSGDEVGKSDAHLEDGTKSGNLGTEASPRSCIEEAKYSQGRVAVELDDDREEQVDTEQRPDQEKQLDGECKAVEANQVGDGPYGGEHTDYVGLSEAHLEDMYNKSSENFCLVVSPYKPVERGSTPDHRNQDIQSLVLKFESLNIKEVAVRARVRKTKRAVVDFGNQSDREDKKNQQEEARLMLERQVFRGRIDSFTAKMHILLGDRRFVSWKGSVVDSVVGVFLTQNVSDTLSSQAVISLAEKFPIKGSSSTDESLLRITDGNEYFVSEPHELEPNLVAEPEELEYNHHQTEEDLEVANTMDVAADQEKDQETGTQNGDDQTTQWDDLRKKHSRERNARQQDSVDWEAVRQAPLRELADAIKARGQHTIIAVRIQEFLNRVVKLHGSIDLEWLRYAPTDLVKEYLLAIRGLGLKSVECIRLLGLEHVAFPVDINVGRIAIRLGWVPLKSLPSGVLFHQIENYPSMDNIQKYLWRRLCVLDQRTLYELHYHMITFGKVFCTKKNPNCNACPMKAECRYFASKIASERLCLPASVDARKKTSITPLELAIGDNDMVVNQVMVTLLGPHSTSEYPCTVQNSEFLVEEPESPDHIQDVEDICNDVDHHQSAGDEEEIPCIKLNNEEFVSNVQYFLDKYSFDCQDARSSCKALAPLSVETASVPPPKLKIFSRLRTEHQVFELPDNHELLVGTERRECDDSVPYMLAIWAPGETPETCVPPKTKCKFQGDILCNDRTCYSCESIREERAGIVRGTILIPCRTAMRGSFPLNGTYFQVNEVFADHETSYNPLVVARCLIAHLPRRTVFIGTSISVIFRGLSQDRIRDTFWNGFICVRGFQRSTRGPKPLSKRFHCPPSKMEKTRKTKASELSVVAARIPMRKLPDLFLKYKSNLQITQSTDTK